MKKIFWILVLGAVGSAAMAVGLGQAAVKPVGGKYINSGK